MWIFGPVLMQNLTLSIPHQLSRAEARQRVQGQVAQLKQQYGQLGSLEDNWTGDTMAFTLTAAGVPISGHLYVEDQTVRVEIPLPWPLAAIAGSLKQQIEQQGRKLLGKS
jgi:putative polyhydroxyalkanoate system protein